MTEPIIEVRFSYDQDAVFEECNGGSGPLSEAEYAENQYMACPDHPRGDKAGDRVENGRAWCAHCGKQYAPVPYAEYLAYYGNPEMHVYLGVEASYRCPGCSQRVKIGGLWNIDFMQDSRELFAIDVGKWISVDKARALPGYAREVAEEQIQEAEGAIALLPAGGSHGH